MEQAFSAANGRRKFNLFQRILASPQSTQPDIHPISGLFNLLGDDYILRILEILMFIPEGCTVGRSLNENVKAGCQDLAALLATSKRFGDVLKYTGRALHLELVARGATLVAPQINNLLENPYTAFTNQIKTELKSSEQIHLLRAAYEGFATHCTTDCCKEHRSNVVEEIKKNRANKKACKPADVRVSISPLKDRTISVSPSADGTLLFTHSRQRPSAHTNKRITAPHAVDRSERYKLRPSVHLLERVAMDRKNSRQTQVGRSIATEDISRTQFVLGALNSGESEPLLMAPNKDNTLLAYIVSVHMSTWPDNGIVPHGSSDTFSRVRVWDTVSNTLSSDDAIQNYQPQGFTYAVNPQSLWWNDSGELVVCWSTGFVHPSGHYLGGYAGWDAEPFDGCPWFTFASYSRHEHEGTVTWNMKDALLMGLKDSCCIGVPQTCSASSNGREVVTLVRHDNFCAGLPQRFAVFHNFATAGEGLVDPSSVWRLDEQGRADAFGGPSCAALSPSGDSVVCVHRVYGKITVEVLARACAHSFVSVQKVDLTSYLSLGLHDVTPFDPDEGHNAVKIPYSVTFSPCSRFAIVLDQRPAFGKLAPKYNLVALDTAMRNTRQGLRVLPMAPISDLATRSVAWSDAGIFIQPSHGTIFLWNP